MCVWEGLMMEVYFVGGVCIVVGWYGGVFVSVCLDDFVVIVVCEVVIRVGLLDDVIDEVIFGVVN